MISENSQRVMPVGWNPLADAAPAAAVEQKLRDMRDKIQRAVMRMPLHEDFIKTYCPAAKPSMAGAPS